MLAAANTGIVLPLVQLLVMPNFAMRAELTIPLWEYQFFARNPCHRFPLTVRLPAISNLLDGSKIRHVTRTDPILMSLRLKHWIQKEYYVAPQRTHSISTGHTLSNTVVDNANARTRANRESVLDWYIHAGKMCDLGSILTPPPGSLVLQL